MDNVTIRITGLEKVLSNLSAMQAGIDSNINEGLTNALQTLRDASIGVLENTGLRWPPSIADNPIRYQSTWVISCEGTRATMVVNSGHAAAVEYGTIGSSKLEGGVFRASTLTKNKHGFPVGASQGSFIGFKSTIRPQAPKSYVRSSINNPMVQYNMTRRVADNIISTLNKFSLR